SERVVKRSVGLEPYKEVVFAAGGVKHIASDKYFAIVINMDGARVLRQWINVVSHIAVLPEIDVSGTVWVKSRNDDSGVRTLLDVRPCCYDLSASGSRNG